MMIGILMTRSGYGKKDGSRRGLLHGGRGRNRTPDCRHPTKQRQRNVVR